MMHIFSRNRKNNLRTLLSLFKGHYGALVGSIFFFIIKHSPTWVLPIVTANIINAVTDHNGNITKILILNTILMIAFLVQNIPTNYIHTWLYAKTVRTVEKELREALVCKLQQLSITYHKEMQSGRLQSKIMRDVEQIQNLASQIFISLLTIILNIGVSFGVVIFKSRIVFLFFLCTIPVSVLIIVGFKGKIKNHNRAFRKEMEETSAKVMEMVEMIPVTKAHALEDQEARKMSEQLRKVAEKGLQLDMIQTYFSSISWVAFQIFQVFCLAFTAYIAWKGIIGVGDITLYQTYFSSIVAQIASIVTLLPIIAKGLESVESIGDVLCANDIEDNCRKKKVVDLKGEITFQDVSFTYKGNEKPVLSHLNFKIQPGETVAFAGGSGSGKTTILNLAIGFLKADSGQVLVDGNDLMELDLHSYRKQIAVVPQQSILFTGTLRENITYGSESISEEQLWNVIRAANLEEVVQKLPDGLDTMITEHTVNKRTALFDSLTFAGREYMNHPMELNIWRAPTDNDMYIKAEWKKAHYNEAYTRAYKSEVIQGKHGVTVTSQASVVAATVQKIMDVTITWTIDAAGRIGADIAVKKDEEFPDLPRFGVRMFLDKKLTDAGFFGMGPQESYRDKHRAASHGLYRLKVSDMHEDYIRPQENGSHYDCDYVELGNSQYGITAVAEEDTFSFNASFYTQEELEEKAHNYELIESDSTVFCLDYAQNGIGSNSCGPDVLEAYRFDDRLFRFRFTLVPYVKG